MDVVYSTSTVQYKTKQMVNMNCFFSIRECEGGREWMRIWKDMDTHMEGHGYAYGFGYG